MRKGIFDPSVGSSAEEGFWPSDARTVQALLCTALLSALFFSWLWQAFRLYSYPGFVPYNDEAGELFHLPLFTGLALLAYGLRLRFRFAEQEPCQGYVIPVLGSTRLRRRLDAAADVDAGCVDGYAGFQRIFRMGTLRQLGRQRSCRDRGRHRRLPHWSGALPVFRRPARPGPWPGEHRCADMQLSCPVVPRAVLGDSRVAFPRPVRLAAFRVSLCLW